MPLFSVYPRIKELFRVYIQWYVPDLPANDSLFSRSFFASGVDSSLYPEISTVLHSDPTADQDHCGRRRFRTRDLCPESRGATNEPPQPIKILYSLSFFGAASHVIFLNIGAQGEAGAGHPVAKAEARAGSVSVRGGG